MRAALALLLFASTVMPTQAMEQRRLLGPEIATMLTDRTATYPDGAKQFFSAAGWTDYVEENGAVDRGRWEVRDDWYCSWWERGGWSCYEVTSAWQDVIFIGVDSRKEFPGRMTDGNQLAD